MDKSATPLLIALLLCLAPIGLACEGVGGDGYVATDSQQMIKRCADYMGNDRYHIGASSVADEPSQDGEGNGYYLVILRTHDGDVLDTCTVEQTPDKFYFSPGPSSA
ncbi:MAG: hypothetical protein M3237_02310 [Actinomycetota bacterium]|nr:hypothetical protein [Actinomycetota bacterium]